MTIRDRGFAHMPPERVREIASLGGKAAQRGGRTHKFTAGENAREMSKLAAEVRKVNREARAIAAKVEST